MRHSILLSAFALVACVATRAHAQAPTPKPAAGTQAAKLSAASKAQSTEKKAGMDAAGDTGDHPKAGMDASGDTGDHPKEGMEGGEKKALTAGAQKSAAATQQGAKQATAAQQSGASHAAQQAAGANATQAKHP